MQKYTLLLLSSNEDAIITQQDACQVCTQRKVGASILKQWTVSHEEMKEMRRNGTRAVNVKCECTPEKSK